MKLSKNKYNIILCILIILQIANIIFWGNQKEGYHIDEIFSYGLSNAYYDPFPYYGTDDYFMQWHDVEYFTDYVMVSKEHRFAYDSVWYNQAEDVHPPLFYVLLHTVCSFFPESFSNWYAISINIVFSALTVVLLYRIACFVFKEKKEWALLVCAAYGFSAGCTSNAVYIRMYVMVTFFVLMFTLLHTLLYEQEKYRLYFPLIALTTVLGTLTHYYFYVFAFFVSAFFCIYLLIGKKWKELCGYVVSMFGSIGISILIFPAALKHIFVGYRGTEAVDNLASGNMISKISEYITYVNLELLGGCLRYIVLAVAAAVLILIIKNCIGIKVTKGGVTVEYHLQGCLKLAREEYVNASFFIAAVAYAILVASMSTIGANRYIFPVYPLIVLYLTWFVAWLVELLMSKKGYTIVTVTIVWVLMLVSQYKNGYIDYLYKGYAATQEMVAQYSESDVLYISQDAFPIYRDMMFVAKANRFICIQESNLEESLQKINGDVESSDVLIYVYKEHNAEEVLNVISKELGYTNFDFLAETYQSRVYYGY